MAYGLQTGQSFNTAYMPQDFNYGGLLGAGVDGMQTGVNTLGNGAASNAGFFGNGREFGMNASSFGMGLTGLATIGNIWNAFQSQKLAKDQFKLTKSATETNLANSIGSYNTALSDRARSRGVAEGQTDAQVQSYIDQNKAVRR